MARLSALKINATLGLDYYGYSLEDAPLLSYDTYSALVSTNLLAGLVSLENSFKVVCDGAATLAARKDALRTAVAAAVTLEQELTRLLDQTMVYALDVGDTIDRLDAEARKAELALRQAQAALEAAIKRASSDGACSVESMIGIAVSVYVVVQSAGTAWTAATGIAGAVGNIRKFFGEYTKLEQMIDKWSILEKELKSLKKNYDDLSGALTDIGHQVQGTPQSPARLPDFKMQKEEFDKIAKDFMSLPEASTFREAGYRFLDVSQARLQAIVDYNAAVGRLAEIQARLLEATDGRTKAESELNRVDNPVLREMVFSVGQLVESALQSAGAAVHRERKALAYHMNQPERAPSSQMNSAILTDLHRQTTERWLAYKDAFNPQLPVNSTRLELDVMKFIDGTTGEEWQRFVREGVLGFLIRRDHPDYLRMFSNLPALRFTGIQLAITGAKVLDPVQGGAIEGDIYWMMELGGIEQVYPNGRPPVRFRHKALRIPGSSAQDGIFGDQMVLSNFSNDGLYAGLSPFTQWRLVISRDTASNFGQQYDLSAVTAVKLRFLATVTY
jgi:hypothetical protein